MAAPAIPQPDALAGTVANELATLRTFVALLGHERDSLSKGEAESLAALAVEKSAMATELTRLAASRDTELGRMGLPSGRAGMDAWLITRPGKNQAAWNELLGLAAEARTLNETNGKLIQLHLQNNQQALSVLMAAVDQAVTYGPDGQQKSGAGGRSLGSA